VPLRLITTRPRKSVCGALASANVQGQKQPHTKTGKHRRNEFGRFMPLIGPAMGVAGEPIALNQGAQLPLVSSGFE
jgi:hypothetical protein